jgi:hypothetical protein
LQFFIKKRKKYISCIFSQFLVIKTLDPDPDPLEMLDPEKKLQFTKGRPSYRRSIQPSKENIQQFKT